MADIFIRRLFLKRGPYTEEEIRTWVREGKLSPRTSAWREGMPGWKRLSEWGFLSAATAPRRRFQAGKRMDYSKIEAEEPGYGRMRYVLMSVAVNAVILLVFWVLSLYFSQWHRMIPAFLRDVGMGSAESLGIGSLPHIILAACCSIWIVTKRLENIGWHWGWAVLTFVPLVNVFIGLALIALPPGYAAYKKLDLIAWFWLLLFATMIGFAFSVPNVRRVVDRARQNLEESLPALKTP